MQFDSLHQPVEHTTAPQLITGPSKSDTMLAELRATGTIYRPSFPVIRRAVVMRSVDWLIYDWGGCPPAIRLGQAAAASVFCCAQLM